MYVSSLILLAAVQAVPPVVVFQGANVVPMYSDQVLLNQTVLVREGRIADVGDEASVVIPEGATVVESRGKYLVPGLFDSHVHLTADVGSRPNFGDAPLYLSFGITSVVNLAGDSTLVALRSSIAAGEVLAPSLYTSGRQINEPLIRTPAEAAKEVGAQRDAGFDLIKFRELRETTTGVDEQTLRALVTEAKRRGVPLVGHVPLNLGLEGALGTGLDLAHSSMLLGGYFWPTQTASFTRQVALMKVGGGLLGLALLLFVALWIKTRQMRGTRLVAAGSVAMPLIIFAAHRRYISPFLWLGDEAVVRLVTVAGAVVVGIALALALKTVRKVDAMGTPLARRATRAVAGISTLGGLVIASSVAFYWLPLLHRSTPAGLRDMARAIQQSGVSVTTTLIVEDTLVMQTIPELEFLEAGTAERWERWKQGWAPERVDLVRRGLPFFASVVRALDREDVRLLIGTDAMGFPLVVPGTSLHREMELLRGAGLSPYRILRAATTEPASFLGVDDEVGTVEIGKRADLLLVAGNPLADLGVLRQPLGVMLRGHWLDRDELDRSLKALSEATQKRLDTQASMIAHLRAGRMDEAARALSDFDNTAAGDPLFSETALNRLGYEILYRWEEPKTAVFVFRLYTEVYPNSWNAFDSFGEAHAVAGDTAAAILNYERSLQLNPENANAEEQLRALGAPIQ